MTEWHFGNASYYELCNGSNGVGAYYGCPCNNNARHIAYPKLSNHPTCDFDCYSMVAKAVCSSVDIEYRCPGGQRITVSIRDCPCFNGCGGGCTSCCGLYSLGCQQVSPPIADLTRKAYLDTGASLALGRIPIRLYL